MHTTGRPEEKYSDVLRTIPAEEIQGIIDAHTRWVTSGKREGKRCDLHGCNLRDADFSNSNLTEAIFTGADLTGAKFHGSELHRAHLADCILRGANFVGAKLSGAVLSGSDGQNSQFVQATLEKTDQRRAILARANFEQARISESNLDQASLENANLRGAALPGSSLAETNLRYADLSNADLRESQCLTTDQVAGTDLSGAQLPEEIGRFDGLGQVTELSKMIRKLFASIIVGCVYSWLTILSITDVQLVTNSRSSPLPIIQTPVPIASFYGVAAFILSALFIYFHLYLARFWRQLASLPAIFPDGKPLDQKAHPWLLNSIIRVYMPRLRTDRPPLTRLEVLISIILTWWAVPFTVVLFWIFSLQKHDLALTGFLILCLSLTSLAAAGFFQLAKQTLRGHETMRFPFKGNWKRCAFYKDKAKRTWPVLTITAVVVILAFVVSDGAFNGVKMGDGDGCPRKAKRADVQEKDHSIPSLIVKSYREIVPRFLPCLGARERASEIRTVC